MKKKLVFMLIIAIFGSFLCLNYASGTFSRFASSASTNFSDGIAVPLFSSNIESLEVPLEELFPGQTATYAFSITNYSGNRRADVSLDYTITIVRSTNLPLEIELFEENGEENLLTNLTTDTFTMPYNENILDNYQLLITWPAEYDEEQYANLTEFLEIRIYTTQKVN